MIIKKFQGKTKEDALELAKKELGDGIVEMNVKTVKSKGLMSFFGGTKIEVTVAKEDDNEKYGIASASKSEERKETKYEGVEVSLSHDKIVPMKQPEPLDDAKAVGQAVAEVLAAFPPQNEPRSKSDSSAKRNSRSASGTEQLVAESNAESAKSAGRHIEEKLDRYISGRTPQRALLMRQSLRKRRRKKRTRTG